MLQVPCSQTEARSGERSIFTGDPRGPPTPPLPPSTPSPHLRCLGKRPGLKVRGAQHWGWGSPVWCWEERGGGLGPGPGEGEGRQGKGSPPCECGVLP